MNTIWSDNIQNIGTLYHSRTLRFSDTYKEAFQNAFCIGKNAGILEIGCGPGALTQSLARWYPDAAITGIDRDSAFIQFAHKKRLSSNSWKLMQRHCPLRTILLM